ncbi:hypothetical protein [Clostridium sp.]|uniref:hypothetical protein n=1 Tax=Clostridium sp. TaxID=1506 RepID=UPI003F67CE6A
MDKYSDRIIFKPQKDYYKSSKWKLVVTYLLFAILVISISWTVVYNILNKPTDITQDEIYNLLIDDDLVEKTAFEEVKKSVPYEPSSLGDFYIVDIKNLDYGVLDVDIANSVSYPAAYVNLYGKVTLKYKKGWYVDKVIYTKNLGLKPLFSAGESFLNNLSNDIYGKGFFEYDGIKHAFATTYVDSLCVITEEGDFDSTKVEIAPYNKDGRVDMEVTLKYNFDIWGWELVDFKTVGTR